MQQHTGHFVGQPFENQKQTAMLLVVSLRMERSQLLEEMKVCVKLAGKKKKFAFCIKSPIHRWNLTVLFWTNELPVTLGLFTYFYFFLTSPVAQRKQREGLHRVFQTLSFLPFCQLTFLCSCRHTRKEHSSILAQENEKAYADCCKNAIRPHEQQLTGAEIFLKTNQRR